MNPIQRQRARAALETFFSTPLDEALAPSRAAPDAMALTLFRDVAAHVPAYRAFLAEHAIDPNSIQSISDFVRLPLITKANYLRRYPLPDLCRDGRLERCDMVAVSSGSTGEPTFWPRFMADELPITTRFEQIFHDRCSCGCAAPCCMKMVESHPEGWFQGRSLLSAVSLDVRLTWMLFGTLFCDHRHLVGSTRISFSTNRHLTSQRFRLLRL